MLSLSRAKSQKQSGANNGEASHASGHATAPGKETYCFQLQGG